MSATHFTGHVELTRVVGHEDTAAAWGDTFPAAASTPFLLAQAELASHEAVSRQLLDGELTVGTQATIRHFGPSRIGATLRIVAAVVESDSRRIAFEVEIFDAERRVAHVQHRRAVVKRETIEAALKTA